MVWVREVEGIVEGQEEKVAQSAMSREEVKECQFVRNSPSVLQ